MNYQQFIVHANGVNIACEKLFGKNLSKLSIDQIENGMSFITEDITIAKFIRNKCCPEDFTDLNQTKVDGQMISKNYLKFYQNLFEEQLIAQLNYF